MTTSSQKHIFESEQIKKEYVLALVNWVIETYQVTEDVMKKQIFEEFSTLADEEIIEKWKIIEAFVLENTTNTKQIIVRSETFLNSLKEEDDRNLADQNIQYTF